MAFTPFSTNVKNLESLGTDKPNADLGLTGLQLRQRFDKAVSDIKAWINDTFLAEIAGISGAQNIGITQISGMDSTNVQAALSELYSKRGDVQDGSITLSKLSNSFSLPTGKLADGAVTAGKIADSAVTSAKVADSAVTEEKIADDAVTASKIADDAVETSMIKNGAVTAEKLASGVVQKFQFGTVTISSWSKIGDGIYVGSGTLSGSGVISHAFLGVQNTQNSGFCFLDGISGRTVTIVSQSVGTPLISTFDIAYI